MIWIISSVLIHDTVLLHSVETIIHNFLYAYYSSRPRIGHCTQHAIKYGEQVTVCVTC